MNESREKDKLLARKNLNTSLKRVLKTLCSRILTSQILKTSMKSEEELIELSSIPIMPSYKIKVRNISDMLRIVLDFLIQIHIGISRSRAIETISLLEMFLVSKRYLVSIQPSHVFWNWCYA